MVVALNTNEHSMFQHLQNIILALQPYVIVTKIKIAGVTINPQ